MSGASDAAEKAAKQVGLAFVSRSVFAILLAAFVVSLSALGAAIVAQEGDDSVYVAALGTAIALVATYHYYEIAKIRTNGGSGWVRPGAEPDDEAAELQVDALRMSDWLVTMPLLVLKFYGVLNRESFGDGYDSLYTSQNVPVLLSIVMVALGAIVRIGFHNVVANLNSKEKELELGWLALVGLLYVGAAACLVLLIVELHAATDGAPHSDLLRSFFLVWVGYPLVDFVSFFVQQCVQSKGGWLWGVAMLRDLAYGMLDAYSKAAFIAVTCGAKFGVDILGFNASIPLVWNR